MKRSIVVTDLTRFVNPEIVCLAGIDRRNGECIRPMPYLRSARCKELKIAPGMILTAEFQPVPKLEGPHQEDFRYAGLAVSGPCTRSEFMAALEQGLFESVEAGFEVKICGKQKYVPFDCHGPRSLITIAAAPQDVEIVEDSYHAGKIKLNFKDDSGRRYRQIGITDLAFHDYAMGHHARNDLDALNRWIHAQQEAFLRLGLSRRFQADDDRDGYWLQVNGIYAFPESPPGIRSYPTS